MGADDGGVPCLVVAFAYFLVLDPASDVDLGAFVEVGGGGVGAGAEGGDLVPLGLFYVADATRPPLMVNWVQ